MVTARERDRLDIIENTRLEIPFLIEDVQRDPVGNGNEPVRVSAVHFPQDDDMARIVCA